MRISAADIQRRLASFQNVITFELGALDAPKTFRQRFTRLAARDVTSQKTIFAPQQPTAQSRTPSRSLR